MKTTFLFIFLIFLFTFAQKVISDSQLTINELLPDAVGTDSGKEYIEVFNNSNSNFELKNAYLINTSQSGSSKKILLPDSLIDSKQYFVFAEDLLPLQISNGLSLGSGKLALYNDFGKLQLYSSEILLSEVNYGDSKEGISWESDGPLCNNILLSKQNTPGLLNSISDINCFENIPVSYPEVNVGIPKIKFSLDELNWTDTLSTFVGKAVYFKYVLEEQVTFDSVDWFDANGNRLTSPYTFSKDYNQNIRLELKYKGQLIKEDSFNINIINNISNKLIVTEAYPSPETGDEEWIEVFNSDTVTINLSNYVLEEKSSTGITNRRIPLFNYTLEPNHFYTIYEDYLNISLNNSGDKIYLFDINGNQINEFSYSQVATGKSVGRKIENKIYSENTFPTLSPTPNADNKFSDPILNMESQTYKISQVSSLNSGTEIYLNANILGIIDKYMFIADDFGKIKAKLTNTIDADYINTYTNIKAKVISLNGAKTLEINPVDIQIVDYINIEPKLLTSFIPNKDLLGELVTITGKVDSVYSNRLKLNVQGTNVTVYFSNSSANINAGTIVNVTGVVDYYRNAYRIIANEFSLPSVESENIVVSYPASYPKNQNDLISMPIDTDTSKNQLIIFGYIALLVIILMELINNRKNIYKQLKRAKSKIKLRPMIKY